MSPAAPRPTLDRRGFVLAAGAVLAAPLTACGGSDEAPDAPASAVAASDRFPVAIDHKFGRTTVPAAPSRVVAVGYNDQDFALALGVRPLGFRQFQGADISGRPWARRALAGSRPQLVGETDLQFEKIAALRPDLILAIYSGIDRKAYDTLSKLAPTVAQTADHGDYGVPWEEQLRETGHALGRSAHATTLQREVRARIARARRQVGADGRTVALASGSTATFSAFASADLRTRFLTDLGLRVPEQVDRLAGESFYADLSEERLGLLDQDLLVIYGAEADLRKRPTFARLRAVREGRTIYLDEQGAISQAIGFSSPLSIPYALDRMVPRMRAALDGDPRTTPEGTGPAAD